VPPSDLRAARGLDPVRDEDLQTSEVAVADTLIFQVRHRVERLNSFAHFNPNHLHLKQRRDQAKQKGR